MPSTEKASGVTIAVNQSDNKAAVMHNEAISNLQEENPLYG